MKIYDFEGFPNPARVRIALAEKGIGDKVEFVTIDVPGGQHLKDDFKAKNVNCGVPVLELDDGTCISECTAITEYLDNAFEGTRLTGDDAKSKALVHMMQRRGEQNLLDAVGDYFHHATPGLGPDVELYQNQAWGENQKQRALDGMAYFNSVLANSDYIAGDQFSMADITVVAGLAFADFAEIAIPSEHSHLLEWRGRMASRPSIAG